MMINIYVMLSAETDESANQKFERIYGQRDKKTFS